MITWMSKIKNGVPKNVNLIKKQISSSETWLWHHYNRYNQGKGACEEPLSNFTDIPGRSCSIIGVTSMDNKTNADGMVKN
jgi:hypothetical protein